MRFESVLAGLLVMLLSVSVAAQDSLGRLLTTPRERQLIANRHQLLVPQTETTQLQEQLLHFDGVVRRDDGRLDVWINGQLIVDLQQLHKLGVIDVSDDENPQLVVLTAEGAVYKVLAGQAFDRQQQRVLESWQVTAAVLAGQTTVEGGAAGLPGPQK